MDSRWGEKKGYNKVEVGGREYKRREISGKLNNKKKELERKTLNE